MGSVFVRYRTPEGMRKVKHPIEGDISAKDLIMSLAEAADGELDNLKEQVQEGDNPGYIIVLNGANLSSVGGLDAVITDGDEVTILLMVSGG